MSTDVNPSSPSNPVEGLEGAKSPIPDRFVFEDLFVLDLANNHQGLAAHGQAIIAAVGEVVRKHGLKAALKFQFRELDTFVHPAHRDSSDNKHVPRFLSTRLSSEELEDLVEHVRGAGMITMATPFDEASVELIERMDLDVIKVASCSVGDWPLIERVAEAGKPVIFSTGGASLVDIDNLVSFLDHRKVHFALMHCVSIYPTPLEDLQLNQIEFLRARYPQRVIGFSTHEDPNDTSPVMVAVAKGARMFERHVGLDASGVDLNAYSSTPDQLDRWFEAYMKACKMSGSTDGRPETPDVERVAVAQLSRGVFARRLLKPGVEIDRGDVYFAFPITQGQLPAGRWRDGLALRATVQGDQPLLLEDLKLPQENPRDDVYRVLHRVRAMLSEAMISLPSSFELEVSHHHGMENFSRVGAVLVDVVNRSYCKKLVIQVPGQRHPNHYHKLKEETFQVLHGVLEMTLNDRRKTLYPGDTVLVQPGVWHEFWSDSGTIFEEISSTHHNDDSYYEDKEINRMKRADRKTRVDHWGRHQF